MNIYKLLSFVFITFVIAILFGSALNNHTRIADNALADNSPTVKAISPDGMSQMAVSSGDVPRELPLQSRPNIATRNYLPIIFLNSATAGGAWLLAGNAGTNPASDFLGTTDGQPLVIRTGNVERVRVTSSGNVGINTTTPDTRLHVVRAWAGSAGNAGDHVALIENDSDIVGNGPDVLALKITNIITPNSTMNYITFFAQSGAIASVEGNGSGGVTYKTSGSDLAEYLPVHAGESTLRSGEIVGLRAGRLSRDTDNANQVFVVSSAAGFVGNMPLGEFDATQALVALTGQVNVRVRGAARAGDLIIPSSKNDGVGVAIALENLTLDQAALVVGRALEDIGAEGSQVRVFVGLPRDAIWTELLQQKETRVALLESRVAALEQGQAQATGESPFGSLPLQNNWFIVGALLVIGLVVGRWWQNRFVAGGRREG